MTMDSSGMSNSGQSGGATPKQAMGSAAATVVELIPKNVNRDQAAVAALILGGAVMLYGLRRGMRGIGPIELTGSMVGAAEFLAYLIVVGGTIRTLQTRFPDHAVSRALAFIY